MTAGPGLIFSGGGNTGDRVVDYPYIPRIDANGVVTLLPSYFANPIAAAAAFIAQRCNPQATRVTSQPQISWTETIFNMLFGGNSYQRVADRLREITQNRNFDFSLKWGLGASSDEKGVYHIRQDWWQSWKFIGFNNVYDAVFKQAVGGAGGSSDRNKLTFNASGKEYTIWMWKGDYINLGTGAETGIYES